MGSFLYDRDLRHELTTLNNNFTEPEVKKENKFLRPRNFDFTFIHCNIYESLSWFVKPLWLIKIKLGDITDKFNKYRRRSPKVVRKSGVLESFAKFTRKHLCRSLLFKK